MWVPDGYHGVSIAHTFGVCRNRPSTWRAANIDDDALPEHKVCRIAITPFCTELFFPRRAKKVRQKAQCLLTSDSEREQEATKVIRSHLEDHLRWEH